MSYKGMEKYTIRFMDHFFPISKLDFYRHRPHAMALVFYVISFAGTVLSLIEAGPFLLGARQTE